MMQVDKAKAFQLPNGAYIKVSSEEGVDWKSLDVSLVGPCGKEQILCSVDYEKRNGLRTIVFDEEHEDPVYTRDVAFEEEA